MTIETFCSRLTRACRLAPGSRVLAAVSGGADSVALLCLLEEASKRLALHVSCAHVEHGIRGAASREDEAFVRALCEEKKIELYVGRVNALEYAAKHGCGIEDAARTLRYAFLERTADAIGADAVALAHHARDQAETVLLHAARGSDMRGLCAMRFRRGRYIRPLLDCFPEELREMLAGLGQDWREDGTNADIRYARNRVRMRVLPELERACPGATQALARVARAAQRDEDFFEQQLSGLPQPLRLVNGLACERASVASLHPALQSRWLVRMVRRAGIEQQRADVIERIGAALTQDGRASINLTQNARVELGPRWLCITRDEAAPDDVPFPSGIGEMRTPFGVFHVRAALPDETGDGRREQAIPAALLCGAQIGSRRPGESFLPFGGVGRVSLKKLMIDAGIDRAMRASVPILRRGEDILWVVGVRAGSLCAAATGKASVLVRYGGLEPLSVHEADKYSNPGNCCQ